VCDEAQAKVIEKLRRVQNERDQQEVDRCLVRLAEDIHQGKNSVPALLECVRAYATIAEMCEVLSKIWGKYSEQAIWI
jgi:methylmalonyl-CoA mutase N-terminal domain/subunit